MDEKRDATFHPGRAPVWADLAQDHGAPPDRPPVDRLTFQSPGPPPLNIGRKRSTGFALVVTVLGSVLVLLACLGAFALSQEAGPVPAESEAPPPAAEVATTGTCEKRVIGEYGLIATVRATNGRERAQTGTLWVRWPVTGEAAQEFTKRATLAPGQTVELTVNENVSAERWFRIGGCAYGWTPAMAPAGWVSTTPPPSQRVIEVVDKIKPTAWRVGAAVKWLDKYTASNMRLVSKCSGTAHRCITVKQGKVSGSPVGWSSGSTVTIDVNKAKTKKFHKWYKYDKHRTWLLVHELGHQFGLRHTTGSNVMNPYVNRYKMTTTASQRAHLRKR